MNPDDFDEFEIIDNVENFKYVSCPNCGIKNSYSQKAIDAAIKFDNELAKTNIIIECENCKYAIHFVPKEA